MALRWRADDGPTLKTGFVAFSGGGVRTPCMPLWIRAWSPLHRITCGRMRTISMPNPCLTKSFTCCMLHTAIKIIPYLIVFAYQLQTLLHCSV